MDVSMLKAHLGDELYAQVEGKLSGLDGFTVIATNDGSWLPKSRLDAEITKRRDLQTTINTITGELNDTKAKLEASSGLQGQVDKLTQDLAERDKTITGMKRSAKIRDKLTAAHIRDAAIGEKLLDMDKIGEDDKGNLTGIDDQIKALQEGSPFLFGDGQHNRGGFGDGKPGTGGGGENDHSDVNDAIRAAAGKRR